MKNLIKSTLMTLISATLLQASVSSDHSTLYFAKNSKLKSYEVKSAIYWSIDRQGKILSFKRIANDFFIDDLVIIEDRTGDEFHSHLTVYLESGKRIDFNIKDNKLVPPS